jgi:hypothetical protein
MSTSGNFVPTARAPLRDYAVQQELRELRRGVAELRASVKDLQNAFTLHMDPLSLTITDITPGANGMYFSYLGMPPMTIKPRFARIYAAVAGAGTQAAEIGLFSSDKPPAYLETRTLKHLEHRDALDDMTSTGVKRNITPFDITVPAGTYLWAAVHIDLSLGNPNVRGVNDTWTVGRFGYLVYDTNFWGSANLTPSPVINGVAIGLEY